MLMKSFVVVGKFTVCTYSRGEILRLLLSLPPRAGDRQLCGLGHQGPKAADIRQGDADADQVHPTGVGEDEQGGVARRPALRVGAAPTEEAAEPQHGQDGDIQGGDLIFKSHILSKCKIVELRLRELCFLGLTGITPTRGAPGSTEWTRRPPST